VKKEKTGTIGWPREYTSIAKRPTCFAKWGLDLGGSVVAMVLTARAPLPVRVSPAEIVRDNQQCLSYQAYLPATQRFVGGVQIGNLG